MGSWGVVSLHMVAPDAATFQPDHNLDLRSCTSAVPGTKLDAGVIDGMASSSHAVLEHVREAAIRFELWFRPTYIDRYTHSLSSSGCTTWCTFLFLVSTPEEQKQGHFCCMLKRSYTGERIATSIIFHILDLRKDDSFRADTTPQASRDTVRSQSLILSVMSNN